MSGYGLFMRKKLTNLYGTYRLADRSSLRVRRANMLMYIFSMSKLRVKCPSEHLYNMLGVSRTRARHTNLPMANANQVKSSGVMHAVRL